MRPFDALAEAARADPPRAALVLGSGIWPVAARVTPALAVPFSEVPGLPTTSVHGHAGRLTYGTWSGVRVLLFEGRLHFYEGNQWETVVRPIRTAVELGARVVVLTNAAGGIRDDLEPGSLMALRDDVEWTRPYCWREPRGQERAPYSPRLLALLHEAARACGVELSEGVYAQLTGPCYETPAEIRALRAWGADAVGMSTAREARECVAAGMECAALSGITNRAAGLSEGPLSHGEVLETAARMADRMATLLTAFVEKVSGTFLDEKGS